MRNYAWMNTVFRSSLGVVVAALALSAVGAGDLAGSIVTAIAGAAGSPYFDSQAFWMFFATLFAIMNPLVALPFFVTITEGSTSKRRQRFALVATIAVFIALLAAALLGRELLSLFAISIPAFRIAGGLVVLLMGLSLLNARGMPAPGRDPETRTSGGGESEVICPLAFPLLAGPGSIATIILQTESARQPADIVTIGAVIAAMCLVTYVVLRVAVPVARFIGQSGLTVLTRLIGMIVAAIAIDMMVIGVRAVLL